MDKFVAWSDAAGLVMSRYDATNLPEGMLAQRYVLADNFFHAAFGGSFLNHFWLVCACTPQWPNAPDALKAQLDAGGMVVKDGFVTPDGYAVNTAYTINTPHPARVSDPARLLPSQTMPTVTAMISTALPKSGCISSSTTRVAATPSGLSTPKKLSCTLLCWRTR